MFGSGYSYIAEEEVEKLAEGEYFGAITNVVDNQRLQGAVDVYFAIQGHPKASPYTMTLFSRPVLGQVKKNGEQVSEEDLKSWDRSMSRFFDAFGIKPGDFDFVHWKSHGAWLQCKKNKNNDYCSLYVSFNQHKEKKEVPEAVKAVAEAVSGTVTPENFPEDINF